MQVVDLTDEYMRFVAVCTHIDDSNKEILEKYQNSRALFINGESKCWGYEARQDELRKEIEKSLNKSLKNACEGC